LSEAGSIDNLPFGLAINGHSVQQSCTASMQHSTDQLIAYASRFLTLKTGDLFYTGSPEPDIPIRLGDHLTAYLADRLLLDCHIR
jgi:2-keto-4-pentenoate hydratase/2-oxohepta-3-ene-1,7-dioic acid hydratase in catechol pathway